ncbi:MAG: glycoside hydrolase family 2 protein, partial [Acetatifactor sp.]|nr:glycoside hydrolase family 2 protein [Acetatifactor sp.]
ALGSHGSSGVKVTPEVIPGEPETKVAVEVWTENAAEGAPVTVILRDAEGRAVLDGAASVQGNYAKTEVLLENPHLWDGRKDPYLYEAVVTLGDEEDEVCVRFGCRTFSFDAEKGFFLNGRSYPLCGVSRHQDRRDAGNALTEEMHRQDMEMIKEVGANTIRLAHYQHDQYFYDLCDEAGMIVWAEIPYITEHMPEGRENTISQMTELVMQNWNHPSIICWGLSNEITTTGGVTEDMTENHRVLNSLCHRLDSSRPTTMANVFLLETDSDMLSIPDIRSYNLYYGWYVGEKEDNDVWFDDFHRQNPEMVIGLSEYGADATICYQTANPVKGDYTEQYQALYHEHMLKMWSERPYIWAMHVWNMFDFAADGRADGGEPGVNHKGLVTFDRKVKKDAFYIYKAYLSDEPFVHICSRRYVDRVEAVTRVKVYSNQSHVVLTVDGKEFAQQSGDKIFVFEVPISAEHVIEARSGDCHDSIRIRKTAEPNASYVKEQEAVVNWFDRDDMQEREGYFSIKDSVASIKAVPEAAKLFEAIQEKITEAYGDVARNAKVPEAIQRQMEAMPVEAMLKNAGKAVTADMVVALNRELNKIPKEGVPCQRDCC